MVILGREEKDKRLFPGLRKGEGVRKGKGGYSGCEGRVVISGCEGRVVISGSEGREGWLSQDVREEKGGYFRI